MAKRERPLCKVCGKNQAVRAGGLCKNCNPSTIEMVKHSAIDFDGSPQVRVKRLDEDKVEEYAEFRRQGGVFNDRPVLFRDPAQPDAILPVGDGMHRLSADAEAGFDETECEVRIGTRRDCLACALSANAGHGFQRTHEDKRKAVNMALDDEEWGKLPGRRVADLCGVTEFLVRTVKKEREEEELRLNRTDATQTDNETPENKDDGENATCDADAQTNPDHVVDRTDADDIPDDDSYHGADGNDDIPVVPDVPADVAALINEEAAQNGTPASAPAAPAAPATTSGAKAPSGTSGKASAAPKADGLLVDRIGVPVSEALRAVFESRPLFLAARRTLLQLEKDIDAIARSPGGKRFLEHLSHRVTSKKDVYFSGNTDAIKSDLKFTEPYCSLCPYCHDAGKVDAACRACKGAGWITVLSWTGSRKELRDSITALAVSTAEADEEETAV